MITGRGGGVRGAPPGALGIPGRVRPGEWLRAQGVSAGLTEEDLAERSGVSVRAIADLERGRTRRPYPSSVRALARALGLPETAGAERVARYRAGGVAGGDAPLDERAEQAGAGGGGAGAGLAGAGQATAGGAGVSAANGASAGAGETTVPRQLPSGVAHFAGRGAALAALDAMLGGGAGSGPGVVIFAVGGLVGG